LVRSAAPFDRLDRKLVRKYSLFVLEVVKAHVAIRPKYPRTIHYRGDGVFMFSGENTGKFRKAVQTAKSLTR
jgi:hypothetical protein